MASEEEFNNELITFSAAQLEEKRHIYVTVWSHLGDFSNARLLVQGACAYNIYHVAAPSLTEAVFWFRQLKVAKMGGWVGAKKIKKRNRKEAQSHL